MPTKETEASTVNASTAAVDAVETLLKRDIPSYTYSHLLSGTTRVDAVILADAAVRAQQATHDYWYLCANCGYVTHADSWLCLNYNPAHEDAPHEPKLIPADSDPSICRCPACGHDHKDDDSGPGFYDGTRKSMIAERAVLASEDFEFESEATHA